MARQIINIGTTPNDGTGDTVRNAFDKVNDNFDEVYNDLFVPLAGTDADAPITGEVVFDASNGVTFSENATDIIRVNAFGFSMGHENDTSVLNIFEISRVFGNSGSTIKQRYRYGDGQQVFNFPVLGSTDDFTINWPAKSGTVAMTSDIPSVTTPGLQAVTNVGATTDKTVGVKSVVIDMAYELKRGTGGFELWNTSIPSAPELMAIFPAGTSQNIAYQSWVANAISAAIQSASATVAGIMRLYTSTGSNTDGTMTQAAITSALNNRVRVIVSDNAQSTVHTGTTADTFIKSGVVPGGTIPDGSSFEVEIKFSKTNTVSGAWSGIMKFNTSDSFSGATPVSRTNVPSGANTQAVAIRRRIGRRGNTALIWPASLIVATDLGTSTGYAMETISVNWAADLHVLAGISLGNNTQQAVVESITITSP